MGLGYLPRGGRSYAVDHVLAQAGDNLIQLETLGHQVDQKLSNHGRHLQPPRRVSSTSTNVSPNAVVDQSAMPRRYATITLPTPTGSEMTLSAVQGMTPCHARNIPITMRAMRTTLRSFIA